IGTAAAKDRARGVVDKGGIKRRSGAEAIVEGNRRAGVRESRTPQQIQGVNLGDPGSETTRKRKRGDRICRLAHQSSTTPRALGCTCPNTTHLTPFGATEPLTGSGRIHRITEAITEQDLGTIETKWPVAPKSDAEKAAQAQA